MYKEKDRKDQENQIGSLTQNCKSCHPNGDLAFKRKKKKRLFLNLPHHLAMTQIASMFTS